MSETTYTVEAAKSGRSKCKKCKTQIAAGELRIGQVYENAESGITMNSWYHPVCFNLPRKYSTGASKMTPAEFVLEILQDTSEKGSILPSRADEIAEAIAAKGGVKKADGDDEEGGGGDSAAKEAVAKIKKEYEKLKETENANDNDRDDDEDEDDKKPVKARKKAKSVKTMRLEAYETFQKYSVEKLKSVLKWNKQVQTGTKDVLLLKVIDGYVYGRLGRCTLCDGGRLKLADEACTSVKCDGTFDEDLKQRIDCGYRAPAPEAPRWTPFYTDAEPSKEQDEEMEQLIAEARGEETAGAAGGGSGKGKDPAADKDMAKLIKASIKQITDWDLRSKEGVRTAAKALIQLFRKGSDKTVVLPETDAEAMQKVGPILLQNKSLSVAEVVPIVVKELGGFQEDKQAKADRKTAAIEQLVKHPKNAKLVAAFKELGDLYFKQGNRNAGASCNKVVQALSDLAFEVTADNAMGLCKGKTKIPNIGKASAERMEEFLTTGTMEKLEQKRKEVE